MSHDAVGNVLTLTELAQTGLGKAITYGYDALDRLTSASTTAASSTPFSYTYTYNSIGNLTNRSDLGDYTYGTTTYANPHAPTSVSGTAYAYDHNGNVTNEGQNTLTWDYANRLVQSIIGNATTTYGYDHTGERVLTFDGIATTTFANKYFNTQGATSTIIKTIFTPSGDLIASISGSGTTTATTTYLHPDQQGSFNASTNGSGYTTETTDYYPYGVERISTQYATTTQQRRYIGQYYDAGTSLSYLNARYYSGSQGQFLSEDPVFWGDPKKQNLQDPQSLNSGRTMGGSNSASASGWRGNTQSRGSSISQLEYLADPQSQNSYSYARGNPITNKDPDGNFAVLALPVYAAWTAPEWVPAVITGIGLAATYITADISLRNNGLRQVPFDTRRLVNLPNPPSLFPDGEPPRVPNNPWLKWGLVGTGIVDLAAHIYGEYQRASSVTAPQQQPTSNSSSLPATVTQGGTTYYRNSSGLLSTKPGQ